MKPFLHSSRLALTPLSPIHIGCGEDFEPTNYVIADGVLYGFDPSRATLSEVQRSKLAAVAHQASLLGIQRFFHDNARSFQIQSRVLIPVSPGVAQQYEQRVGRAANLEASGNAVFNQLFIERVAYTGRQGLPYIPGSSFKGVLRTAIVDALNDGRRVRPEDLDRKGNPKSDAVEKRLLQGDFETSPLRLLKVADLMPTAEPERRIMFAVNRKKRLVLKDGGEVQPRGIAARKEVVLHGQYRAFGAEAVITSIDPHDGPKNTPTPQLRPKAWRDIAQQTNRYHLIRLKREIQTLDGRGLLNPDWKRDIEQLLNGEVGQALQEGRAMLVRLGRYGGATSKTLSGAGVAQIKIMQGKGQPPAFEDDTKTVWLAAEHENDQKHLIPFGWAVVEIDPEGDCTPLRAWCERQSRGRPDMPQIRAGFAAEQEAAERLKAEEKARAAAREAAAQAEREAAAQRVQALAAMTPQGQQIETLRQRCEALATRIRDSNFRKEAPDPGRTGVYQDAIRLVKVALESADWSVADKSALADMLEQWLSQVLSPWDQKEQRKKLKLSALRGIA